MRNNPNMGNMSFMDDIPTRYEDPTQPYWDILLQSKAVTKPGMRPVVQFPKEVKVDPFISKLVEEYLEPKLKKALDYLVGRLQKSVYFNKNPIWREPSITSRPIDVFNTSAGIALAAPVGFTNIINVTVPQRTIAIIDRFGNSLENAAAFGDVEWRFATGATPGTPLRGGITGYDLFSIELGSPANPTQLASQLIISQGTTFNIEARNNSGVTPHIAFARVQGWLHTFAFTTADGSFGEYFTL